MSYSNLLLTRFLCNYNFYGLSQFSESKINKLCSSLSFQLLNTRCYAVKWNVPIKWERQMKVLCIKPEKSGDLKPLQEIDLETLPKLFKESEELSSASNLVKRVFTHKFASAKTTNETVQSIYVDNVKWHDYDSDSLPAIIAKNTAQIRRLQQLMDNFPRNVPTKVALKELIDKRKKRLKILRKQDYKCFEWLLDQLDLVYKPQPITPLRVERKRSIRFVTDKHCEDFKENRLKEYRKSLEAQQKDFLVNKIKTLLWIQNEEKECGAEPSVNEQDIDNAKAKLEDVLRREKQQQESELDFSA